eukprot:4723785-Amphidinium_carterae.1
MSIPRWADGLQSTLPIDFTPELRLCHRLCVQHVTLSSHVVSCVLLGCHILVALYVTQLMSGKGGSGGYGYGRVHTANSSIGFASRGGDGQSIGT